MLTEQEQFWRQDFGNEYVSRNRVDWKVRVPFWQDIIERTKPKSILEIGCGSGWNLRAIREVDDMISAWGCDINQTALQEASDAGVSVFEASVLDIYAAEIFDSGMCSNPRFDLVASVGVLIHVSPTDLPRAMDQIISASNRYVLAVEYADETEVEVEYRGNAKRLWRRPFGRLYEERGLKLVAEFDAPADAFDRCRVWIMERP